MDLARRTSSALFVLNVIQTPVYTEVVSPSMISPPVMAQYIDFAKKNSERWVGEVVKKAEASGLRARGEIVENVSSVVEAVTEYAAEWKVDLIVVGTRGLGGFKKLLMGSVSSGVLSHASCSVLVVR